MKYTALLIVLLLPLLSADTFAQSENRAVSSQNLIHQVIRQVQTSITTEQNFGYYQEVRIRKINAAGTTEKEETRVYRTVWIQGHPYNELSTVNGRPLNLAQRSLERKRKTEFLKSLEGKGAKGGLYQELQKVPWNELALGYRFTLASAPDAERCLVNFKPSGAEIREQSRFQKILQHMTGNLLLDTERNVMEANGRLAEPVRFGLGIIAKVEDLEVHFRQRPHEGVWAPAQLYLRFKARIAIFKVERQEINIRWYDPYPRPTLSTAQSSVTPAPAARREK